MQIFAALSVMYSLTILIFYTGDEDSVLLFLEVIIGFFVVLFRTAILPYL